LESDEYQQRDSGMEVDVKACSARRVRRWLDV
jgi:hypothetical protein